MSHLETAFQLSAFGVFHADIWAYIDSSEADQDTLTTERL